MKFCLCDLFVLSEKEHTRVPMETQSVSMGILYLAQIPAGI